VIGQHPLDFRADGIGGPLAFVVSIHGNDATGIDGVIGEGEFCRDGGVVPGGDEGGVVVGDQEGGVGGELVEDVVRVRGLLAEIEAVADAERVESLLGFRDAGDDEGVDAVVGVGVGAGEALVDQNGQTEFIRFFDGVIKCVIRFDPPVHLGPVEDVLRAG